MHPLVKAFIGIIILIVGAGLLVDEIFPVFNTGIKWFTNFKIVLTGIVPVFLILLGLFITWLEIDEWKIEKEIEKEEKEIEKEEKKKKGRKKKGRK